MPWDVTDPDVTDVDQPGSAALMFRLADNSAERWQQRGRMASVCWDFRDPVDVASISNFRRFLIPELRMLPGMDTLKLRLRYQVTHVEGVKVRWTVLGVPDFTPSPLVTLTSLTPANHDVTLDVSEWLVQAENDRIILALEIQSQEATSESVITLRLIGVSEWFIQTGNSPSGPPSVGGLTDRIECLSMSLVNAVKGLTVPSSEIAGGPYQCVSNGFGSASAAGTDAGFYIWPKLTIQTNTVPITANYFSIFGDQFNRVDLQIYARLQFWSVGIEQIPTSTFPVVGRSERKPVIEDGTLTKAALRPDYPGRDRTHIPLYLEGQRELEEHTTIHSIGPYAGTNGLDFQSPNPTDLRNGTWQCYPSVVWNVPDVTGKELFGCRVGDDPEFRVEGGTTLVRRAYTVDVAMVFVGGINADHQFVLDAKLYSAGNGTPNYEAPSVPFLVRPTDPTILPRWGERWEALLAYTLAHPNGMSFQAPGSANPNRRSNMLGLWELVPIEVLERHLVRVTVEVFNPDAADPDPEVLTVECRPSTTGTLVLGDRLPLIGDMRCFVIGWNVQGKTGGPALATGA